MQVTATEPNNMVTYSIDIVGEQDFDIDANGAITLQVVLDRETQDTYEFQVYAADSPNTGASTSTVHVQIVVIDVNDEEPQFVDFIDSVTIAED
ncbi:cadherin repeat domain-containing protein, partial [Salmonella sp. s51228]|uniref:cadherin repeat domain-containing protein n=1 Tax=Salmonella sp. s51228 TaxID=3159652 RepID=UPI00397F0E64